MGNDDAKKKLHLLAKRNRTIPGLSMTWLMRNQKK